MPLAAFFTPVGGVVSQRLKGKGPSSSALSQSRSMPRISSNPIAFQPGYTKLPEEALLAPIPEIAVNRT